MPPSPVLPRTSTLVKPASRSNRCARRSNASGGIAKRTSSRSYSQLLSSFFFGELIRYADCSVFKAWLLGLRLSLLAGALALFGIDLFMNGLGLMQRHHFLACPPSATMREVEAKLRGGF